MGIGLVADEVGAEGAGPRWVHELGALSSMVAFVVSALAFLVTITSRSSKARIRQGCAAPQEAKDSLASRTALEIGPTLFLAVCTCPAGDALVLIDLDFLAHRDGRDGHEIAVVIRHEIAGDLD